MIFNKNTSLYRNELRVVLKPTPETCKSYILLRMRSKKEGRWGPVLVQGRSSVVPETCKSYILLRMRSKKKGGWGPVLVQGRSSVGPETCKSYILLRMRSKKKWGVGSSVGPGSVQCPSGDMQKLYLTAHAQ